MDPVATPGALDAGPVTSGRARGNAVVFIIVQCLVIAAILFVYVRGWDRDFTVPLRFSDDSLSAGMQSKSTVDNGWWWFNPRIGAPFGLDELQYPADSNVDQAIVWAVSRVVHDAPTAINLSWFVMVVLSGVSATWCVRQVGASRSSAFVAGTLFALTPFALFRNLSHFWLVVYLVPFASTAALLLASGRPARWYWGRRFLPLLAGCVLLGFNYPYYPFFACFLLLVALVVGAVQYRAVRLIGAGAVCMALIGTSTVLNLVPNFRSWAREGKPLIVPTKSAAESEQYGLNCVNS